MLFFIPDLACYTFIHQMNILKIKILSAVKIYIEILPNLSVIFQHMTALNRQQLWYNFLSNSLQIHILVGTKSILNP